MRERERKREQRRMAHDDATFLMPKGTAATAAKKRELSKERAQMRLEFSTDSLHVSFHLSHPSLFVFVNSLYPCPLLLLFSPSSLSFTFLRFRCARVASGKAEASASVTMPMKPMLKPWHSCHLPWAPLAHDSAFALCQAIKRGRERGSVHEKWEPLC